MGPGFGVLLFKIQQDMIGHLNYLFMEITHMKKWYQRVCTCKRLVIVCAQTNGGYELSVHPFTYETTK